MLRVLVLSAATFTASFGVTTLLLILRERFFSNDTPSWQAENDLLRW
jgi:hypothetical protein